MPFTRTTMYLGDTERQKIKKIQARYGLATLSDGIRLAIHVLASLSAEQETMIEQFKPQGRKRAERKLHNEGVAAEARRISEEAGKVRVRTATFLTEAKAKKAMDEGMKKMNG